MYFTGAADYFIKPIESHLLNHTLQEAIRKNTFSWDIANFSSELRTPLTPIVGYSELLVLFKEIRETYLEESLHHIWQNARRLAYTFNDFFDTLIEFQNKPRNYGYLKFAACSIDDVFKIVRSNIYGVDGHKRSHASAHVTVTFNNIIHLPLVCTDLSSIAGIVSGLIEFSLMRTSKLHAKVTAYLDELEHHVVILITMNEKVIHSDDEFNSKYGGYFYTQQAVRANGGRLWYENRDDKTIFYLELPVYKPEAG